MAPSATTCPVEESCFSCELRGGIEVSPLDKKHYRYLTLSNELKVFLVSDASSDKAAAALNLGVGSFSDPENLPGLAHFLEHMIFLGTEKYPNEGSWNQAIGENSGTENAYTSNENTNYHFQILVPPNDIKPDDPSHVPRFKEMLDRFSQFFIAPLFTESATDRELNAVDQEHQKNLQSDVLRMYYVEKAMSNPNHPFSRFSSGNRKTLWNDAKEAGIDTRAELLKFYEQYYSSNLMNLCVAGPYSLDILEEWVTELFTPIKNSNLEDPSKLLEVIRPELSSQKGVIIYIDPIKDTRTLELIWFIPPTKKLYRSKPYSYISRLIGHQGKGSLLSYLKAKKWVNSIYASMDISTRTFAAYSVYLNLTEDGEKKVDDIVEVLYGYLNLLKGNGIGKWIYDEAQQLRKMGFYFREGGDPYGAVRSISEAMEKYPPTLMLSGSSLYFEYNPDLIKKCLMRLTPDNCSIFLSSKAVKNKCNLKEKWYGTSYGTEKIPDDLLSCWSTTNPVEELRIPEKNEFIPTDFHLVKEPLPEGVKDLQGPVLLEKSGHFELYHKLDRTFNRPRAYVYLNFICNQVRFSPRHFLLAGIFAELLEEELSELASSTSRAGLGYSFRCRTRGLSLCLNGYNDKLRLLLCKILEQIVNFNVDPAKFERILDIERRGCMNQDKMQPYSLTSYNLEYLLLQPRWHYREHLEVIESGSISAAAVQAFVPELLERMYIVGFCGGNVTDEWARTVVKDVTDTLKFKPLPPSEFTMLRVSQIPLGHDFIVRTRCPNSEDVNSAVEIAFQLEQFGNFKFGAIIELWKSIVREPVFNELRTAQQLGYIVSSGVQYYSDVATFYVLVQSTALDPDGLRGRIVKFLADFRLNVLGKMTKEVFAGYVESYSQKLREPEKSLGAKMQIFWSEIRMSQFVFNREERILEALKTVVLEDVIAFFDEYIAENAPKRRCLTAMVHGNMHPLPSSESNSELKHSIEINDPIAFRNLCAVYPTPGASVDSLKRMSSTGVKPRRRQWIGKIPK